MQNPENLRPSEPDRTVILIAEDEVVVRNVAEIVLEDEGYFVLSANDGEQALVISRQYPGKIHLLVSDIKMPHLDGLQLRERILEERPGIKILLMSGYVEPPIADCPFLKKPFVPAVFKERVHQLLASAATAN